jgi:putative ABC transport system permease protein
MAVEFRETTRVAWDALVANPLRSLLTSLGIIIGVLAVVGMSSLIQGLSDYVQDELSEVGSEAFYVQARPSVEVRVGGHSNTRDWRDLELDDREAIERNVSSVAFVSAYSTQFGAEIRYGTEKTNPNVLLYGADGDLPRIQGLDLESGRFLSQIDDAQRRQVVILGQDLVERFFSRIDPLGQEVRIDGRRFRVVGILASQGEFLGFSQDNLVMIPVSTFRKYWGRRSELALAVQARPGRSQEAIDETTALLRRRRGLRPIDPNDFEIVTAASIQETMDTLITGISVVMLGIASISLLVGGIGIMNIMLVSVTERTREIGIRKAVGARRGDIVVQFLIEAVVLSGVGGLIGAALGTGLGLLVGAVTPLPASLPLWALVTAFSVCAGIGVVFGVYPAVKASRLDPVDALRYE